MKFRKPLFLLYFILTTRETCTWARIWISSGVSRKWNIGCGVTKLPNEWPDLFTKKRKSISCLLFSCLSLKVHIHAVNLTKCKSLQKRTWKLLLYFQLLRQNTNLVHRALFPGFGGGVGKGPAIARSHDHQTPRICGCTKLAVRSHTVNKTSKMGGWPEFSSALRRVGFSLSNGNFLQVKCFASILKGQDVIGRSYQRDLASRCYFTAVPFSPR